MIYARQHWLSSWNIGTQRGRHDYDCDEHTIEEMQNAAYFGAIYQCLSRGDYIFVTDAKQEHITFVVDDVDAPERKVWISVVERVTTKPVTASTYDYDPCITVRWRGPRGGLFCLVNSDDVVVEKNFRTRVEAEKALQARLVREKVA